MPENCVTTQKKLSLACDTTAEPAPIATTTNADSKPPVKPSTSINGATMEAVVISATVEEPCAVLIAAAIKNGNQIPRFHCATVEPSTSAIPEFCSTLPKIPPAPVIKIMEAAPVSALPIQPSIDNMEHSSFLGNSSAKKTPTSKATKGSPKNIMASLAKLLSSQPANFTSDLATISTMGTKMGNTDLATLGAVSFRCWGGSSPITVAGSI